MRKGNIIQDLRDNNIRKSLQEVKKRDHAGLVYYIQRFLYLECFSHQC